MSEKKYKRKIFEKHQNFVRAKRSTFVYNGDKPHEVIFFTYFGVEDENIDIFN